MKICTIVGARPQFIKAAMVSRAIREHNGGCHPEALAEGSREHRDSSPSAQNDNHSQLTTHDSRFTIHEVLVHTGQHYDFEMSQVFFDQLDIPEPNYHLEIGSGSHGDQTGRMLAAIEKVLLDEKPDAVLVYGDTNSTLAGALAAVKLHIPVGHVEGGMRSFNRRMPEEINRVLTDHVATWHFCPTETAIENLKDEGIAKGVHLVGDVMYDAIMLYKDVARGKSDILQRLNISKYALATIHRAENTDDRMRLRNILEALVEISKDMAVVLPLHPRTKKAIENADLSPLITTEPLSYLDTLCLEQSASIILTDSGGMQKEAFWLGVPCVTMRDETEWVETVDAGMNKVVGADKNSILRAFREFMNSERHASQPRSASCQTAASKMIIECLPSGI